MILSCSASLPFLQGINAEQVVARVQQTLAAIDLTALHLQNKLD